MKQMQFGQLLDQHFVSHGNWQGVSLGTISEVWLSHILSEGDHRLSYVEEWVANRQETLVGSLGQAIRSLDFSDDHLAAILQRLSNDEVWMAFEGELNQQLLRVYDLKPSRVRLDSTTASGHWTVSEAGLFQYGHSKDHRPDLPQLKVMVSSLDPLGLPLVTTVVAGHRADDPLYRPAVAAVRASLGVSGLLYVGDVKMAALASRGFIAAGQDYYLCPLSQVQLSAEQLDCYLKPVWNKQQALTQIKRSQADGQLMHLADGFELECQLEAEVNGQCLSWTERHLVIRSLNQVEKEQARLAERLTQAQQALAALNQPRQGHQQVTDLSQLQQRVAVILKQYQVQGLLEVSYQTLTHQRHIRAYRERPARLETWLELQVNSRLDQPALELLQRRFGWRVYATNAPSEQVSLVEATLAYRDQYRQERGFARLKNKPLSLSPMYLHREDHAKGLVRLLSLGLRILTLLEFTVQEHLSQQQARLAGLYPGNPKQTTARPTAERLLKAFENLTLTIIEQPQHRLVFITPLSELQQQILALLGFSVDIYARFNSISLIPP
jgi:transposase